MSKTITTTKGNSLCIHDTPGEKGTIIASHGLTGNHKQLHHLQEALKGEYRFISYDIRGRGDSDPALQHTSIFTHADELVDLIETLHIKHPILMGYSMGAYICALVASRLPDVEALILLDGAGEPDETSRELVLPSLNRLEKIYPTKEAYVEEVKQLYTKLQVEWTDTLAELVEYDVKKTEKGWEHKSDAAVMEQDFETFYDFKPEQTGKEISCDTFLLIARGKIGGKAPLFKEEGYEKTKKSISHLSTYYSDVNHYELVFNEQPDIVQQLESFLEQRGEP